MRRYIHSFRVLVSAIVLGCSVGLTDPVHAGTTARIVLGPPFVSDSLTDLAAEITLSLEQGLAQGKLVVERPPAGEPARAEDACKTPDCARALGLRLGADVVVTSHVHSTPRAFTVSVTITRTRDGVTLGHETLTCEAEDPCPPIAQSVHDVAREAARKALPRVRELSREVTAGGVVNPGMEDARLDLSQKHATKDAQTVRENRGRLHPAFWIASLSIGIATTAFGVSVLMLDGEQVRAPSSMQTQQHKYFRDYFLGGTAITTTGAVLITGTVLGYLLWNEADRDSRFAIGPGSLSVRGRF